ncbi:phosphoribosylglycinamide synthetase [Pelagophyceae sp. CCMP2097]|nr:phosphoribosylglycinamide synthetase [Pelagophyceae sp. CCMP2097]|mmetsp:Transcript_32257/g.110996  ORF Transcript_32257/g.110996 Transcript_32257/m.110996 type:complete len:1009 (-) Transcript_32257:155-3181(-)|eukprot:CAMPEP_0184115882 /NCGR_PEP_ID=MMETSP0974-20121125/20151_1 /TAXON_ID=483370 /ORGANISM="non described non described, Strain CCMP2097" /LENGTH=1008 /DNA_ID=CAMNT_0026419003 /DNA_START=48 /DNA_END=3074 /DNA_ORIENTATION=+
MGGHKVMVIGGGGREHAIVVALAASPRVERIWAAPGNGGTALMGGKVSNVDVDEADIAAWAKAHGVALVIIGPEQPLVNGVADAVVAAGIPCFGPTKAAAIIEASKAWSKDFMVRQGLRTARFAKFARGDVELAVAWAAAAPFDIVAKASGLAAGKGVLIPEAGDAAAAEAAVRELCGMTDDSATDEIVLEERLDGPEVSLLAWCDGARSACMPPAQDHKRAHDGDRGLNTGGMGAYAPTPVINASELRTAEAMMQVAVTGLAAEGRPFVGVLYGGFMLTREGPVLLEFNARFGDPETQVLLPLLKSDAYDVMLACATGDLRRASIEYRDACAATVVIASKGYPKAYAKGLEISGVESANTVATAYHAGTKIDKGKLVTSGGRVLAVSAVAHDLKAALSAAYAGAGRIAFKGAFYRGDVAHRCVHAPVRVGVLGSTRGTSLQAVLDAAKAGSLRADVKCVFSDKADAPILARATGAGVAAKALVKDKSESRDDYDAKLTAALEEEGVELVLLVGWMRILSPAFVAHWKGRCFNVHPSLLPEFGGGMDLDVHAAVLAAGKTESGCTVHEVTDDVDSGVVVVQKACAVLAGDDADALKQRVQLLEGAALVEAVSRFGAGDAGLRFAPPAHCRRPAQVATAESTLLTYQMAGVDIDKGNALVERIKPLAAATKVPGSGGIGGFGAMFDLAAAGFAGDDVVLVSGADGVGTKLKMAADGTEFTGASFDGAIGIDLVAMCVNDVVTAGAQPLFFLDYYASASLDVDRCAALVAGVANGCKASGCCLAGGETAEMPGLYAPGDYDVAGFCVGAVRRGDILPRNEDMSPGDVLIALPSDGVHANGFSLVRRAVARLGTSEVLNASTAETFGAAFGAADVTMAQALLAPTRLYVKAVLSVMKLASRPLLGAAHITGGGLSENLPRVLPKHLAATMRPFKLPPLFQWLRQSCGDLPDSEVLRTFNCGIGMILVVKPHHAEAVLQHCRDVGETGAFVCGGLIDRGDHHDGFVIEGPLL